jgi:hypothetical protein
MILATQNMGCDIDAAKYPMTSQSNRPIPPVEKQQFININSIILPDYGRKTEARTGTGTTGNRRTACETRRRNKKIIIPRDWQ